MLTRDPVGLTLQKQANGAMLALTY